MSVDDIISDVIDREGGATATNDATDKGGRTQYGISEKANPKAWADGVVTEKEAREIFLSKYVVYPGYLHIPASHRAVQEQLIDFAVLSGPYVATEKLQATLNVKVDGVFGPKSLVALAAADPRITNNKLAIQRALMICRIVKRDPSQLKFLAGWIDRTLSFIS